MSVPQAPALVPGEAPESDEDTEESYLNNLRQIVQKSANKSIGSSSGSAIVGEAIESDDEVQVHITHVSNSTSSSNIDLSKKQDKAIITDKIQLASLKKLREKNRLMYESLASFKRQILTSSNYELGNINQQLLKSQVELQQTLNNIRVVKNNLNEYKKKLNNIVAADYIPPMNISVPARVI